MSGQINDFIVTGFQQILTQKHFLTSALLLCFHSSGNTISKASRVLTQTYSTKQNFSFSYTQWKFDKSEYKIIWGNRKIQTLLMIAKPTGQNIILCRCVEKKMSVVSYTQAIQLNLLESMQYLNS